ncbi:MAG: DNA internalization-related competence protein ComEC/Rec2 [Oceanospirillaceae bacterium]|nr:DNA internalization-related competence protein ComEC/Rec2 [Oceanospirillaceae bacterium]
MVFLLLAQAKQPLPDASVVEGEYQGVVGKTVQHGDVLKFDFIPDGGDFRGMTLSASCYRCQLSLRAGQVWQFKMRVSPLRNFHNPGGADYRLNRLVQGVVASAYVMEPGAAQLVSDEYSFVGDVRNSIYTVINKSDLNSSAIQMTAALAMGDKQSLSRGLHDQLINAGLIHLFVVSGLHVSMVFAFTFLLFNWLLRICWVWRFPPTGVAMLLAATMALFYGALTGFAVPALRAVFSVCMVVVLSWRMGSVSLLRLWLLSALFVVLIEPLSMLALGAQLSFLVVLAFVFVLSGRHLSGVRSFWLMQLAAFAAGAFLLLQYNLPVPLAGLLLNAVFIPLVSLLLLPLTFMVFTLGLLQIQVWPLIWLINHLCDWVVNFLDWAPVYALNLEAARAWPFLMALLLMMLPAFLRLRFLGVALLLVSVFLPVRHFADGWRLWVFDVGQGSAQLIQVGDKNILVDTGDKYQSGTVVADFTLVPALRALGVEHLDMVLISHHDSDHSGGLASLQARGLIHGPVLNEDNCAAALWGIQGVQFKVLQAADMRGNNRSCVLAVTSSAGSVLLPGDIERKAELAMLNQLGPMDVLIAAHHGSKTSSSAVFLDALKPGVAVISAGFRNRYGHPHSEVLARLDERGVQRFSTATDGAVLLRFSPRQAGPSVSTYRPDFYPSSEE